MKKFLLIAFALVALSCSPEDQAPAEVTGLEEKVSPSQTATSAQDAAQPEPSTPIPETQDELYEFHQRLRTFTETIGRGQPKRWRFYLDKAKREIAEASDSFSESERAQKLPDFAARTLAETFTKNQKALAHPEELYAVLRVLPIADRKATLRSALKRALDDLKESDEDRALNYFAELRGWLKVYSLRPKSKEEQFLRDVLNDVTSHLDAAMRKFAGRERLANAGLVDFDTFVITEENAREYALYLLGIRRGLDTLSRAGGSVPAKCQAAIYFFYPKIYSLRELQAELSGSRRFVDTLGSSVGLMPAADRSAVCGLYLTLADKWEQWRGARHYRGKTHSLSIKPSLLRELEFLIGTLETLELLRGHKDTGAFDFQGFKNVCDHLYKDLEKRHPQSSEDVSAFESVVALRVRFAALLDDD